MHSLLPCAICNSSYQRSSLPMYVISNSYIITAYILNKLFSFQNTPEYSVTFFEVIHPVVTVAIKKQIFCKTQLRATFHTHGSVHHDSMLIKVQLDATVCRNLFTATSLYMFRVSRTHHQEY